jgi:hypothetical protein
MDLAHFRHTLDFSGPPTIAQIERQLRWEAAAVEAGIRRYREELADPSKTLADTSPGQRIIREIMKEFVPWLSDAQDAIRQGLVQNQGKPRDWNFLILLLPPEHLAFLTLRAVMSDRPCEANMFKRTLTSCIRSVVASIGARGGFSGLGQRGTRQQATGSGTREAVPGPLRGPVPLRQGYQQPHLPSLDEPDWSPVAPRVGGRRPGPARQRSDRIPRRPQRRVLPESPRAPLRQDADLRRAIPGGSSRHMEPRRWQHPDLPEWSLRDYDSARKRARKHRMQKHRM